MFLGTHNPRLDEKGRLVLPARFRDELAGGLVMTKGQERCLYVFPTDEFERVTRGLREQSVTDKRARDFSRVLFASATSDELDKQNRLMVPPPLREYAGLSRDLAVIGADTRIEIWDAPSWDAYLASREQAFIDMAEEVAPGVL